MRILTATKFHELLDKGSKYNGRFFNPFSIPLKCGCCVLIFAWEIQFFFIGAKMWCTNSSYKAPQKKKKKRTKIVLQGNTSMNKKGVVNSNTRLGPHYPGAFEYATLLFSFPFFVKFIVQFSKKLFDKNILERNIFRIPLCIVKSFPLITQQK